MFNYVCIKCRSEFTDKGSGRKYCSRNCFEKHRIEMTLKRNTFECKLCGKIFSSIKRKSRIFCSNDCKIKNRVGQTNSPKTRERIKLTLLENGISHNAPFYIGYGGFVIITGTNKKLHTQIAEKVLGRKLKNNEVVHHVDGDRSNNENSNLVICDRILHPTLHARTKRLKAVGQNREGV